MSVATIELARRRGDTFAHVFTITDGAGAPIDITGHSFALTVDPSAAPADASANLFAITGAIIDAPAGKVSFAPDVAQADQTPGTYHYDVQMTDAGGRIRTIAAGKYKIVQDITK